MPRRVHGDANDDEELVGDEMMTIQDGEEAVKNLEFALSTSLKTGRERETEEARHERFEKARREQQNRPDNYRSRAHMHRGGSRYRSGDNRNQVVRPIVFTDNPSIQAVRDIIAGYHDNATPQGILESTRIYQELGDMSALDNELTSVFLKAFTTCSLEIPAVATLVSVVHATNASFMYQLLAKVSTSLIESLQNGTKGVFHAKMLLRSVACLASCGVVSMHGEGGFLALISSLFPFVHLAATQSTTLTYQDLVRGDTAAYLLASTIPYLAEKLMTSLDEYAAWIGEAEACLSVALTWWASDFDTDCRRAIFHVNVTESQSGPDGVSCWDNLWEGCTLASAILAAVKESAYAPNACLASPWIPFLATSDEAESLIQCADPYALSADTSTQLTASLQQSTWFVFEGTSAAVRSWKNARFPIFDADAGEAAGTYSGLPLEYKHLVGEFVRDVLVLIEPITQADGTKIGSVQLAASHMLAIAVLFDEALHVEYGIIETLLTLALQPGEHHSVYVYTVLLELCKLAPSLIPPVLAAGCGVLYQLSPALDTTSWRSLCKYLIYHLANFKLSWPYWSHWEQDFVNASYGEDDTMRCFCKVVVDGLGRVMFRPTLLLTLPTKFKDLAQDGPPNLPLFHAFSTDPKAAVATKLAELVERRAAADDIEDWLDSDHEGIDATVEGETWQALLLMQAIVHVSKRLLSTVHALLDTYRDLLRTFLDVDGGQEHLVVSLSQVFAQDGGMLSFVLDALIRRSIVQPIVIARWVFSEAVLPKLTSDVWLWVHINQAFERSIDMIKAALVFREKLFDVTQIERKAKEPKPFAELIPGVPMGDDDEDDDLPIESGKIKATQETIAEAEAALLASVAGSRQLCMYVCITLIETIKMRRQLMAEVDELHPFLVTTSSLLRSVLRTAITAHESVLDGVAVYARSPGEELTIFDPESVQRVVPEASLPPTIAATWKSFVSLV